MAGKTAAQKKPPPGGAAVPQAVAPEKGKAPLTDVYAFTERIILDEYAPPGVLIDRNHEILQFFGLTNRFLSNNDINNLLESTADRPNACDRSDGREAAAGQDGHLRKTRGFPADGLLTPFRTIDDDRPEHQRHPHDRTAPQG